MKNFFITGVSHHQAPVAMREKFVGLAEPESRLYSCHTESGRLGESLVLSTCNRLEILAVSPDPQDGAKAVLESLSCVSGLSESDIQPYIHHYTGLEAAGYLFRISSSLESLVLGESQILGQVKEAFRQSLDHRRAGTIITKLMHRAFRTAKRVRSETCLAGGTVSVASAAVSLAKAIGGDLAQSKVLLLGAGPMAALAAAHLSKKKPADLIIMNRSLGKAEALARKHGMRPLPWDSLNQALVEADLVITATGARQPVLTAANIVGPMALRASRPLVIIDIGVPRNAAHDLKHVRNVILRNIDDLNEVVWESRAARQDAARRAEKIVEEEVGKFGHWLKSLESLPTVAALTQKAENIRQLELERTLSQHRFSEDQVAALEAMTGAIVRKLLHDPLAFIKEPGPDCGQLHECSRESRCINALKQAFNI